jgi:prepilin-type N-terminal cleavage/methylation domain-containing protein/prepilin-type processing-associated H-X9-DG protein
MTRILAQSTNVRSAFTLVELTAVIAIIAVLIALLLPAITKAKRQATLVQCASNMRQIGMSLLMYTDQNSGYLFPSNMGWNNKNVYLNFPWDGTLAGSPLIVDPSKADLYHYNVWTTMVFVKWNPPIMICPTDDPLPNAQHTYILNYYISYYNEKYGHPLPNAWSPSDAILMGEKTSTAGDYYMEYGDYRNGIVDPIQHGLRFGSNYLMLDLHVETKLYDGTLDEILDPWDFGQPVTRPS